MELNSSEIQIFWLANFVENARFTIPLKFGLGMGCHDMTSTDCNKILKEALLNAALGAIVNLNEPMAGNQKSTISTTRFVRGFKEKWFLSNDRKEADSLVSMRGPILFLFAKNVSVTNLSLNELLSLVRTFSNHREKGSDSRISPQFSSDAEYSSFFRNMWESIFDDYEGAIGEIKIRVNDVCEQIVKNYSDVILRMAIFDTYFTTAFLNMPLSMSLNLREVVANSGYVHSAGKALYVRNSDKANKSELMVQLREYLRQNPGEKFFLIPYADEFVGPPKNNYSAASLRNGLDGVRFNFWKHSVGRSTLQEVLAQIPEDTDGYIVVPKSLQDYRAERLKSLNVAGMSRECTIWLILDHNVHETDKPGYFSRGTEQYFMVYAQLLINNSQLSLFKERKPGWLAPVTLPHTLSASLANIAYERWAGRWKQDLTRPVILDPFCGSGTTLIDFSRCFQDAVVIGLDKNPIVGQISRDNLAFFAAKVTDIKVFRERYCGAWNSVPYNREKFVKAICRNYEKIEPSSTTEPIDTQLDAQAVVEFLCGKLLLEIFHPNGVSVTESFRPLLKDQLVGAKFNTQVQRILDGGFSEGFQDFLVSSLAIEHRWLCLLLWRGLVYGRFSVNIPDDLYSVIESELLNFAKEMEEYERLLDQPLAESSESSDGFERFVLKEARFSLGLSISQTVFSHALQNQKNIEVDAVVEMLANDQASPGIYISHVANSAKEMEKFNGKVDIVVTDPPYGFNMAADKNSLLQLYGEFFGGVVRTLKPEGQLIVALPEFTRNGKRIPFYQTKAAVVQLIVAAAQSDERRIVHFGGIVPDGSRLLRAPYYWASTSGVSRSILHFTIY